MLIVAHSKFVQSFSKTKRNKVKELPVVGQMTNAHGGTIQCTPTVEPANAEPANVESANVEPANGSHWQMTCSEDLIYICTRGEWKRWDNKFS